MLEGALVRETRDEEEAARRRTGRCESDRRDERGRVLGRAITNGMRLAVWQLPHSRPFYQRGRRVR